MNTTEMWRISPSLPEYLVSSMGRVMRVPYFGSTPNGGRRQHGGTPHFGQSDGYRMIFAFRGKTYKVHRLVCEAFNGTAPDGKPIVMHINEDGLDNRADNLAWGTQKENLNAPGFIAYCKTRTGDNSPARKGRAKQRE